jgi:hypothetical protein
MIQTTINFGRTTNHVETTTDVSSTSDINDTQMVQKTMDEFYKKDVDDMIDRLLQHPLSLSITSVGSMFSIQLGQVKRSCGGLLRVLERRFYHNHPTPDRWNTYSSKGVGIMVHRQLYHTIHCKKHEVCDCDTKTRDNNLNFMTKEAYRLMSEKGFTPVDSEVRIFCKRAHCGTKLDVVGYLHKGTKKQTSCVISIKTGKSSSVDRTDGIHYLAYPYEKIKSTTRNHNRLQALAELMILESEYGFKIKSYYIFHLRADGTSFAEEPDVWWGDKTTRLAFYNEMCKKVSELPKKKKAKKVVKKVRHKDDTAKKENEKKKKKSNKSVQTTDESELVDIITVDNTI